MQNNEISSEEEIIQMAMEIASTLWGKPGIEQNLFISKLKSNLEERWNLQASEIESHAKNIKKQFEDFKYGNPPKESESN